MVSNVQTYLHLLMALYRWEEFYKNGVDEYQVLYTCMFVAVNFDALAQASDIRIARRQVVFLWWM